MAAFQFKNSDQVASVVLNTPPGPTITDLDTGMTYVVGEVITTALDLTKEVGYTAAPGFQQSQEAVGFATKVLDAYENDLDFRLQTRPSLDFQFLVNTVIQRGTRP
jgi:hypothetical protein